MGRRKRKGVVRRSGFEDRIEKNLKSRKIKYKYEPITIKYQVPERTARYVPDFVITRKDGSEIIVEAKGKWDPQSRAKMALVVAQNPDLDIRMMFMRDNYIRKGSKTKYSEWADKNNIKWAVGEEIPQEWLS